jgi:hypothetical protein
MGMGEGITYLVGEQQDGDRLVVGKHHLAVDVFSPLHRTIVSKCLTVKSALLQSLARYLGHGLKRSRPREIEDYRGGRGRTISKERVRQGGGW